MAATTPHITAMRRSLWDALDNWSALEGVFKRKWRHEGSGGMRPFDLIPGISDMPAIEISLATGNTPWVYNQGMELQVACRVSLWTRYWDLLSGERLFEEINRAFWQCCPDGTTQTYVAAATIPTSLISDASITHVALSEDKAGPVATLWQWTVLLKKHWNPRIETGELVSPDPRN